MPRCYVCKTDKEPPEFYKDRTRPNGISSKCKACLKDLTSRSPEKEAERSRRRRNKLRAKAIEMLGGKCARCGWSGPQVGFDIHHRHGGGEAERAQLQYVAYYRRIVGAPGEYELLCALCHRLHHG